MVKSGRRNGRRMAAVWAAEWNLEGGMEGGIWKAVECGIKTAFMKCLKIKGKSGRWNFGRRNPIRIHEVFENKGKSGRRNCPPKGEWKEFRLPPTRAVLVESGGRS